MTLLFNSFVGAGGATTIVVLERANFRRIFSRIFGRVN